MRRVLALCEHVDSHAEEMHVHTIALPCVLTGSKTLVIKDSAGGSRKYTLNAATTASRLTVSAGKRPLPSAPTFEGSLPSLLGFLSNWTASGGTTIAGASVGRVNCGYVA